VAVASAAARCTAASTSRPSAGRRPAVEQNFSLVGFDDLREQARHRLAHMLDAERQDEAIERNRAARIDGGEKFLRQRVIPRGRLLALRLRRLIAREMPAEHVVERVGAFFQLEDVRRLLHQPGLVQELKELAAQSLDVEGIARGEMIEPLHDLRRARQRIGTTARGLQFAGLGIDLAHRVATADRTSVRHLVRLRPLGPAFQHHAHELRNDVAGALHDRGVADAHVLARNFVLVVQRNVLHYHAADGDGLDVRDRR